MNPPSPVEQTQDPITGLESKVHCYRCHFTDNKRTLLSNWLYSSSLELIASLMGHGELCKYCFPPAEEGAHGRPERRQGSG